jgi:plasmid stabilization system protein ParE
LIGFTARAAQQFRELRQYYEDCERPDAIRALIAALEQASRTIEADPEAGFPAPRPYPQLARPGRAWVKSGRYWIAYTTTRPPVIAAVFYETANIPGRL